LTLVSDQEKVGIKLQDAYRDINRQKKLKKSGIDITQKLKAKTDRYENTPNIDESYGKTVHTFTDQIENDPDIILAAQQKLFNATDMKPKRPVTSKVMINSNMINPHQFRSSGYL
jgi:hypothetical protein